MALGGSSPGSGHVGPFFMPISIRLDVTDAVHSWLAGSTPNLGLAVVPVSDRSIDEGYQTRFQVYASESGRTEFTPELILEVQP